MKKSVRKDKLSKEDILNLKEAAGERGYTVPRFNPRTGKMLSVQWKSWLKLQKKDLVIIEGGGEADDLVLTELGKKAVKSQCEDGEKKA